MVYDDKTENFIRAFTTQGGSIRRTCECGREFYDCTSERAFEPGELEALRADPNATGLDYSVGTFFVGGVVCVIDCDCWHKLVAKWIAWIDMYGREIAEYLTLEKQRLLKEANRAPTVEADAPLSGPPAEAEDKGGA